MVDGRLGGCSSAVDARDGWWMAVDGVEFAGVALLVCHGEILVLL